MRYIQAYQILVSHDFLQRRAHVLKPQATASRDDYGGKFLLRDDIEIEITSALYEPHAGDYCAVIADHGDLAKTLLVIGHNPAIQATAVLLCGSGDPAVAAEIAAKFPTAALAVLDFKEPDWSRLKAHSGAVVAFVTPRGLAKGTSEYDGDD